VPSKTRTLRVQYTPFMALWGINLPVLATRGHLATFNVFNVKQLFRTR
jgi:hypothetical protein